MNEYKSGFVSVIGRPNVGKSTLINQLIGEKISIISSKPQTTRNQIQCILSGDGYQVVFIDTPGIHVPKSKLGSYMVKSAETALNEIDTVLFVVEPRRTVPEGDKLIIKKLENVRTPVFLVINKIDTVAKNELLNIIESYSQLYGFAEVVPISALKAEHTDDLQKLILKNIPEGPQYFPEDMLTDQPERQVASEIIREKVLYFMQDEIPHGAAVEIIRMKTRQGKDMIDMDAVIYCEKDSHKGMIIGKKGEMLKKIGSGARHDIERLLGSPVYLQLWVKVKKGWRDNDFLLKNFGYGL